MLLQMSDSDDDDVNPGGELAANQREQCLSVDDDSLARQPIIVVHEAETYSAEISQHSSYDGAIYRA
jgi:hypothetical protein